MPKLTVDQVKSLAPDQPSLKSAQGLADARHWVSLGCNELALWGECKGSGKEPYKVRIDLTNMGYACTCPSRKFPCKHGLGLMLLSATSSKFSDTDPPLWVTDWLDKREERKTRVEKKAQQKEVAPENLAARQKDAARRVAKRGKLADAGIASLEKWLQDFARIGLASAQSAPSSFWDDQSARMVDSQLPGVARLIREMESLPGSRSDWAEILLLRLARLHLLVNAYHNLNTLPEATRQDVHAMLGWSINQEELLASAEGIHDHWLVLHSHITLDEKTNLRTQTNWLWGQDEKRIALILNFAHQSQAVDASLTHGLALDGELVFFPGAHPMRAILKEKRIVDKSITPQGLYTIHELLENYASALANNPWLEYYPAILQEVTPTQVKDNWMLQDSKRFTLPLPAAYPAAWELYALGGGSPLTIFGIWDGFAFAPLAAWQTGRIVNLI